MRVAVLSDIHGNSLALQAVWEDLQRNSPDLVVCLGDHLWGSLEPGKVASFLMAHEVVCISGNQDQSILHPSAEDASGQDFALLQSELSSQHLEWLRNLPATLALEGMLLCHGTPTSDTTYLLETVTSTGARLASEEEVLQRLEGTTSPLVLCGHSHQARTVQAGPFLVVNPGSVGMPAYTDDLPHPHPMESGSPHARYALLTLQANQWQIDHKQVVYDWQTASRKATRAGRYDRAQWLRTGRA